MSWVTLNKTHILWLWSPPVYTRLHKSNAYTQILLSDSIYEFVDLKVWNSWYKLIALHKIACSITCDRSSN